MESFYALLKNVLNHLRVWPKRSELRYEIIVWIEHTYNRRRRQRALGRLTPSSSSSPSAHPPASKSTTRQHEVSQPPSTRRAAVPRVMSHAATATRSDGRAGLDGRLQSRRQAGESAAESGPNDWTHQAERAFDRDDDSHPHHRARTRPLDNVGGVKVQWPAQRLGPGCFGSCMLEHGDVNRHRTAHRLADHPKSRSCCDRLRRQALDAYNAWVPIGFVHRVRNELETPPLDRPKC